jgi:hypothetical protein
MGYKWKGWWTVSLPVHGESHFGLSGQLYAGLVLDVLNT